MKPTPDCQTEHYHIGAFVDQRYRLTEFIGAGGMACVYKAQEEGTPHAYALKFLKAAYHNQEYLVEYFRDEASSMRDLAHPNIVRFYRFVHEADYSYIIMDYVDGFPLSEIIKQMYRMQQEIPLDEVVRIMIQVARALDAIHREGYVHRDIKPSNVLIARQTGQTYLTDLGITAAANTRIEGAGTLAYMSPETTATGVADHRADIYSYGIMFFEMLAKRRPFRAGKGLRGKAAEADLTRKHREAAIPNLSDYRPELPQTLNGIMHRALAKQPDARYDNIMHLARDIHDALVPFLSEDMHDFALIQARRIAVPKPTADADSRPAWLRYAGWIAAGAVILLFGVVVAASALSNASTVATPTPVATDGPNPIENQPLFALVQGVNALALPDAPGELHIRPIDDQQLRYLRIGLVDGFRIRMDAAVSTGVSRYGVAFRLQDAANYLLYRIAPDTGNWQFVEVLDGTATVQAQGRVEVINPLSITITGRQDFFQVKVADEIIELQSTQFETGSLALWIERGSEALEIETLSVDLIGPEARTAAQTAPTPAPGLGDLRRFLRADVNAMLATDRPDLLAIDCPIYIDIYERLEAHRNNRSPEVRALARDAINAGEIVYARCLSESPNTALVFGSTPQDYLDWGRALRDIQAQLEVEEG